MWNLAVETGVTEAYAKQVYFKRLANPSVFITTTKDKLSGQTFNYIKSTSDLTIDEMRKAISGFLKWAADNGYYLPKATLNQDGTMSFNSETEMNAYNQAVVKTSKLENSL